MYQHFAPETVSDVIPLPEMADNLNVCYHTVIRWAKDGVHGVQLRVCRMPRGYGTTRAEYDRFIRAINGVTD